MSTSVIAYAVCTFGSPSWALAEAGVTPIGPRRYGSRADAERVADQAPGTGSCTMARVAALLAEDAAPDISLAGGRGWIWAVDLDARARRAHAEGVVASALADVPEPVSIDGAAVAIDREGFLVVSPPHGITGERIAAVWPAGLHAAKRLRAAVLSSRDIDLR